jgi:hypothetical protein
MGRPTGYEKNNPCVLVRCGPISNVARRYGKISYLQIIGLTGYVRPKQTTPVLAVNYLSHGFNHSVGMVKWHAMTTPHNDLACIC